MDIKMAIVGALMSAISVSTSLYSMIKAYSARLKRLENRVYSLEVMNEDRIHSGDTYSVELETEIMDSSEE